MAETKSRIGLHDANIAMGEVLRALGTAMCANDDLTIAQMKELTRTLRQATEACRHAVELRQAEEQGVAEG